MCIQIKPIHRNVIDEIIQEIEIKNYYNYMPDWPAVRPSAFPKSEIGLIIPKDSHLASAVKRWGYEVPWSKQPVVNTRDDSAMNPDKMWWDSIQNRRCIIPTFGFYEPHKTEKAVSKKTGKPIKQQYFFELHGSQVTFIAGIYEDDHFSMMTTKPSASMKPIHDRMPMVLFPNELKTWLYSTDFPTLFDRQAIILDASKVE